MITKIKTKIRSLIEDSQKTDFETFTYSDTNIFTISEENINSITAVLVNGVEIGTGDYSFNSTTNKITITSTGLAEEDNIEVDYTYYKYSDSELTSYIRSALSWMSLFGYGKSDYEIESTSIVPTPDNRTTDVIAIVTSILINPDYTRYSLPNSVTVVYNNKLTKFQKIEKVLDRFSMGLGDLDVLRFE